MPQYGDMDGVGVQRQEGVADDGVLRNGIADLAARRAHLRAMAVARQAVEQRHMHPAAGSGRGCARAPYTPHSCRRVAREYAALLQ